MPRRLAIYWLCALVAALPVTPVLAAPAGENVIQGEAEFTRDGNTTTIDTFTTDTAIQYDGGFDILHDEIVQVNQPTNDSRLLNYVPHGDPTVVNGQLLSNGFVYIVNPAGVFAGNDAIIDVGGLVAAAGDLSLQDFADGKDRFTNLRGNVVIAPGAMVRGEQGVALLGRRVANFGTVVSERGLVAFVAGENAVLGSLDGHVILRVDGSGEALGPEAGFALTQAGSVDAGAGEVVLSAGDTYSLAMNHTGVTRGRDIRLEAQGDGLVQVAGTLDASAPESGAVGGDVTVLGGRIAVLDARIDASGDAGGGRIRVGGDAHGEGDLPTARRSFVGSEAELVADALTSGDGGTIIVWADEKTGFYGSASARGGATSGDGGFVEISGRQFLETRGHSVDLSASNGESGTLLYDPLKIEIRGGTADGSDDLDDDPLDPPDASQLNDGVLGQILAGEVDDEPFVIYESEIEGTDADIILQAQENIATSGMFDDADVVVVAGNSLLIQTTGDPDPSPDAPFSPDFAIDLNPNVTWRVSEGGMIAITTGDPNATDAVAAAIRVGDLEFGGRSFIDNQNGTRTGELIGDDDLVPFGIEVDRDIAIVVQTNVGDIEVGSISANGDDAADAGLTVATDGGRISLFTETGNIQINGDLRATGGNATAAAGGNAGIPSRGGTGGAVEVIARNGDLLVLGDVDVSGGDGVVGFVRPEDLPELVTTSFAGTGGSIGLATTSDGSEGGAAATVTVAGDLIARGGQGNGMIAVSDAGGTTQVRAGIGGLGGLIAITGVGGVEVAGSGSGSDDRILIDASGGDGLGGGGDVSASAQSAAIQIQSFSGDEVVGSGVRLANVEIVADGGDGLVGGPGAPGGAGGGVVISAGTEAVDAAGAIIRANGGAGAMAAGGDSRIGIVLAGNEGISIGDIEALGGLGQDGVGGTGGDVDIASATGDVVVANIDVSGGDAETTGENGGPFTGGAGGFVDLSAGTLVEVIDEDTGETLETPMDVVITGAVQGFGGTQLEDDGSGMLVPIADAVVARGATLRADADGVIDGLGTGSLQGGRVELEAPEIRDLDFGGTGADADIAILTSTGSIAANLIADGRLEQLDVVHTDLAGSSTLTTDSGATPLLTVLAEDTGAGDPQRITRMQTGDTDPTLNYELNAVEEPSVDTPALQIDEGAVSLGSNGGSITNDDGAVLGEADALTPHATSVGDLVIDGRTIGSLVTPLFLDGNDGLAEPEVALGLVAGGTAIVDATDFGEIELSQSNAAGSAVIDHDNSTIVIGGDAGVDPVQTLMGETPDGAGFTYRLTALTLGGQQAPALEIEDLRLGGDALLEVPGQMTLVNPDSGDAVITVAGAGRGLTLDAGGDLVWLDPAAGEVAIQTEGTADDPTRLVLSSGRSVASSNGDALVVTGVDGGALSIASLFGEDFRLEYQAGNADLVIEQIEVEATPLSGTGIDSVFTGISGNGDVELDANGTGSRIVLGEIPAGALSTPEHIDAGGDVALLSDVVVENAQFVEVPFIGEDGGLDSELVAVNSSLISAGGDLVFSGRIDTGDEITAVDETPGVPADPVEVDASLALVAGGQVHFQGDVGAGNAMGRGLALLDTTAAVLDGPGDTRTFHADESVFRGGINGPLAAEIRGAGSAAASSVAFGGDVGAGSALGGLDVLAESIDFSVSSFAGVSSAERVVTGDGGISLDTGVAGTPELATIADTAGNLSFQTSGAFAVGQNDKLSAVGALSIQAASVAVGDLSASSIDIRSSDISLRTRDASDIELADGSTTQDGGVDWVANAIRTSSTPVPTGTQNVSFYVGSGGVSVPDLSGIDVRRLDAALSAVSPSSFVGQDGAVLDLTGDGPPLVGDPTRQMARRSNVDLPSGLPGFGEDPPGVGPQIGAREALAFLRCSGVQAQATGGSTCGSDDAAALASLPRFEESALATARAREITARYRDLVTAPGAVERLRAAFATAGRGFAAEQEWQDGTFVGEDFYRFLERAPWDQRAALRSVRELAWLFAQIDLLGMADADTRRLQQTLAQEFADAAGLEGFSAEAVTAAVQASPIGLVQ